MVLSGQPLVDRVSHNFFQRTKSLYYHLTHKRPSEVWSGTMIEILLTVCVLIYVILPRTRFVLLEMNPIIQTHEPGVNK